MLRTEENTVPEPQQVESLLREDPAITHVALVHCQMAKGLNRP